MERDRCRQDETGQKLDVKKCDGIVKRFTRTGDRRGKKFRDEYPCTPESSVGATCVAGDLNLFCSKVENPFWISAIQSVLAMLPAHPSTLSSRYFGDNPSENSFVGELVTPGSHWTSVLNNVSFSFKISVQGFAEQALPGLKSTATWPSMVEVRPSGKDSFFLPVPTGDRGESSVFDLAVGEKEANVGLSGSGLGMSRIKWARLDVNLL